MLSQWYPTPGLYNNRDVEGIYLLLTVPHLSSNLLKLPPKPLVEGCKDALSNLKLRLNEHESYTIGDKFLMEWNRWLDRIIPTNESDVNLYIRNHQYYCPLITYFREGIFNDPTWDPPPPRTSFSIFPSHVVVALPTVRCQFEHHGPAVPYMPILMSNDPGQEDLILNRYNAFINTELIRMKTLKKKGLLKIVARKVKEHGTRFAISGMNIDKLCGLLFDCDLNFFLSRLDDDFDNEQNEYISNIFEGGEKLNLNLGSNVVSINNVNIKLGDVQSLAEQFCLHPISMNAFVHLFAERDQRLCEAYDIVNKKKSNYKARKKSLFLNCNITNILFSMDLDILAVKNSAEIAALIQDRSFLLHYRIVLPYFWSSKCEWVLIIIEYEVKEIHFIFTRYSTPETSASSSDERVAFKMFAHERLVEVLIIVEAIGPLPAGNNDEQDIDDDDDDERPTAVPTPDTTAVPVVAASDVPRPSSISAHHVAITSHSVATTVVWKSIFQNPQERIPLSCHRTPYTMNAAVKLQTDSGLYILYAMECDYSDAPIYAIDFDWIVLRRKFAYWLLNSQLII